MSYLKGSEHMKKTTEDNRKRRHITIADDLYTQVAIEAAKLGANKGKVIEEAIKKYFGGEIGRGN